MFGGQKFSKKLLQTPWFLSCKRDCSAAATDLEGPDTEERDLIPSQCPLCKYLGEEETWLCGRFQTTGKWSPVARKLASRLAVIHASLAGLYNP